MNIRYLDIDELNERLDELTELKNAIDDAQSALLESDSEAEKEKAESSLIGAKENFGAEEAKELEELEELKFALGESRGGISTEQGPLIHCDDFTDYARELAEETGALDRNASWPMTCIDWEQAAKELRFDYSIITFQGNDYYYRA